MEDNGITSEDKELLAKLKELIKKDKLEETELDDEEIGLLRDMIKIYESFKVFGRFARIARNIVIFVGSFLVGWFVLIDNLHVVWNKIISVFGG
jgi:hypothetical protein